jgi:hypothetical protein
MLDPGLLALATPASTEVAALDAAPDNAPIAERAIVAGSREVLRLVCYRDADALAVVSLDPLRAIQLASELTAAAARHLAWVMS